MKRIKFFVCTLALGLALVGCTGFYLGAASVPGTASSTTAAAPERVVLFDTPTLKITLAGRVIVVEDKTAQQTYCISR